MQKVYSCIFGKLTHNDGELSLGIMNIVWCGAPSGTATDVVIYTGQECRAVKNNRQPWSKIGILPYQHSLPQLKRNLPARLQE